MRLDVMGWTRAGSTGNEALRGGPEQRDDIGDDLSNVADEQDEARQHALHHEGSIGSIAFARTPRQLGIVGGRAAHQRGDVVGQYLGRHVDDQCLLRQPRHCLEMKSMLEPLEGSVALRASGQARAAAAFEDQMASE